MLDEREPKSIMYAFSEDGSIMLVLYVDKKKNVKENIVLLTRMQDDVRVTKDE